MVNDEHARYNIASDESLTSHKSWYDSNMPRHERDHEPQDRDEERASSFTQRHSHTCECGQEHTIVIELDACGVRDLFKDLYSNLFAAIRESSLEISRELAVLNRKQDHTMSAITDLKDVLVGLFADQAALIARLQASVDSANTETHLTPEDQVAFDQLKASVTAARAAVGDENADGTPTAPPVEPPVEPTV
jgi:hypothetical protein